MNTGFASLPYRPGVGVMLLNPRNEIFVGQRIDSASEAWQMPQGGIDEGEEPYETALRELEEETGILPAYTELLGESRGWLRYDLPDALIPSVWNGRFRGQEQKWFALRFTGGDEAVNLNTPHPEFRAWRWVTPASVPELIVPFKQTLYRQLLEEFAAFI